MKIVDLIGEWERLYFVCLEDWSEEIREADPHKEVRDNKLKIKGPEVRLAMDENGNKGGMIQYTQHKCFYITPPIEEKYRHGD